MALVKRRRQLGQAAQKGADVAAAMMYEVAQLVAMAITFPIVARSFGPDVYGEFTTMYVIAGYASTWVALAGGAASVQLLLQHRRSPESVLGAGRRQVWWSSLPLASAGVIASVLLFGSDVLGPALLVFGGDVVIGGFANMNASVAFAERGVVFSARLRIVQPVCKIVGMLVLVVIDEVTLLTVVTVNALAVVALALASRWPMPSILASRQPDATETSSGELLRYTGMYAATISANATQDQGEKIVLAAFRPPAEVGEYGAAYRIVELALMPLRAVDSAATRWFLVPDGRSGIHVERAKRMSLVIGLYGVVAGVAIVVFRDLTSLVIGDEFELAVEMVVWLSGFPLVRALADVPVLGLLALDRNKPRMWLGLAGAAFALASYLVLVPTMGWQGGVIGTYASEVFTLVGGWILLVRYQRRHDREASEAERVAEEHDA